MSKGCNMSIEAFIERCGGRDSDCDEFENAAWRGAVMAGDTREGYWQWAYQQMCDAGELVPLLGHIDVGDDNETVVHNLMFVSMMDAREYFRNHAKTLYHSHGERDLTLHLYDDMDAAEPVFEITACWADEINDLDFDEVTA